MRSYVGFTVLLELNVDEVADIDGELEKISVLDFVCLPCFLRSRSQVGCSIYLLVFSNVSKIYADLRFVLLHVVECC